MPTDPLDKPSVAYVHTCQLVSQLMYQASNVYTGDFEKITDEMLMLTKKYTERIQNLKKEKNSCINQTP